MSKAPLKAKTAKAKNIKTIKVKKGKSKKVKKLIVHSKLAFTLFHINPLNSL
jgi:hypothetical protein